MSLAQVYGDGKIVTYDNRIEQPRGVLVTPTRGLDRLPSNRKDGLAVHSTCTRAVTARVIFTASGGGM